MRRALARWLPLVLLLLAAEARAETPIPPPPERWVTDRAAFLSPATAGDLDARLGDYAQRTGHQVLVYIDRTTGGVPIEDWGVRAFQRWRVGRRGIDDGLVMLVFADDRRVRLEVGYGLEGTVPDAIAKRIIEDQMLPRIRAGDHDGAIRAGVAAVTAKIDGKVEGKVDGKGTGVGIAGGQTPPAGQARPPAPIPGWMLVVGGIVGLLLIGFLITHPSLAWLLLMNIGSGRRGGGGFSGGGGGGGFSGGGGGSGGGGASGSW
jgi:uncharacterized protein